MESFAHNVGSKSSKELPSSAKREPELLWPFSPPPCLGQHKRTSICSKSTTLSFILPIQTAYSSGRLGQKRVVVASPVPASTVTAPEKLASLTPKR